MSIKVTPEELDAMAGKLEGFAGQTTTLATNIKNAVDSALAAWEGNAQRQYAERFESIYPVISAQLPQLINDMATDARTRAEKYRAADA